MTENGGNVHDGTHAILRVIQADMAGVKGDIAELRERLGGVENRLDGLAQEQRATFDLVQSVAKSVTTMGLAVEAAVEKVLKSHQLMAPRLNIIEGRLAAIEEHTGMFRA
jgi:hypothetical protein